MKNLPPKDELEDACARWGFRGAAIEYGVGEWTIIRWLRSMDATPERRSHETSKGNTRIYDYDQYEDLARQQLTAQQIAQEMGCNEVTVYYMARVTGVRYASKKDIAKSRHDQIIRLRQQNMLQREIAAEVGCSIGTVRRVLQAVS